MTAALVGEGLLEAITAPVIVKGKAIVDAIKAPVSPAGIRQVMPGREAMSSSGFC